MELWIRSQDREKILKCDGLVIYCTCEEMPSTASYEICDSFEGSVAKYKTKERALEVLDEIQKLLTIQRVSIPAHNCNDIEHIYKDEIINYVYEMPER